MIEIITIKPSAILDNEPQNSGLLSSSHCPPPRSVKPTLMRLIPMIVMTVPVTIGVMSFLSCGRNWLKPISINAPKKHTPIIIARISSGPPPCAFAKKPAARTELRNAKLVPWTQIIPAPTFIGFLAWMIVPTPETISAILIR